MLNTFKNWIIESNEVFDESFGWLDPRPVRLLIAWFLVFVLCCITLPYCLVYRAIKWLIKEAKEIYDYDEEI